MVSLYFHASLGVRWFGFNRRKLRSFLAKGPPLVFLPEVERDGVATLAASIPTFFSRAAVPAHNLLHFGGGGFDANVVYVRHSEDV